MEYIGYEDFSKLNIRMGKVVAAEKVADADRLLKLTVDTGDKKRTLVAGIAEYYSPEEITGLTVPVLINLEPRKIRGIESMGMILAADEGGRPVLLKPNASVQPGAKVR